MIADAIDKIKTLCDSERRVKIVSVNGMPDNKRLLTKGDGTYELLDLDPATRSHRLATLQSLEAFALAVRDGEHATDGDEAGNRKPALWMNSAHITLVLNDRKRWDFARLALDRSDPWLTICQLATVKKQFSQRALIDFLRNDLHDCGSPLDELLKLVRKVKFRSGRSGQSEASHGVDKMGAEINAEVSAAGDIPEYVTAHARMFKVPDLTQTYPIKMAVNLNAEEQTFNLTPVPMAIENAEAEALKAIEDRLGAHNIPIYRGEN